MVMASGVDGAALADTLRLAIPPAVTFALGYLTASWRRIWRWLRREDPLQVHVETNPEIIYANTPDWITFPQFVPLDITEVPPPPQTTLELSKWAKELGGMPVQQTELQVTIRAWDDLGVIVDTLRVKAKEHALPKGKGVVIVKPVGGASIQRAQLDVELSTFGSIVTPRKAGSGEAFDGFAFQLKPGEVKRFLLHIRTNYEEGEPIDAYEWTASLDLLVQNKRKTVQITDNGKPFVLVNSDRYSTFWWMGNRWEEQPDRLR